MTRQCRLLTGIVKRPFRILPALAQMDKQGRNHRFMTHAQPVSIFSRGRMIGRVAIVSIAVLSVLATPGRLPAQDAGVSGIPPGPANARGLNGSVNDPSGIGNAARVPAIPSPTITPVMPSAASPAVAHRAPPLQRAVKIRRTRFAASRLRGSEARAAVRERDKLLDRGVPSICRGC